LMVRDASVDELRHAQAEAILVNRMIANHRRRCPHCTSVFTTVPPVRSRSLVLDTSS
jgi:transcriptional regulator NrdR family protein